MYTAIGNVDYVAGHLRYGHYELNFSSEKEVEEFKALSREKQEVFMREYGELIVDDVCVDDIGDINSIDIY